MSFKKCKLVMLPTNEKAIINLNEYRKDVPTLNHSKEISNYETNPYQLIKDRGYQPQHLYILSDEEIKEGDYNVPSDFSKTSDISKTSKEDLPVVNNKSNGYKKIIATTDKSLEIVSKGINPVYERLPQIPQSFIEYFVEEYNKGNVNTEVMVEYEEPYSKLVGSKIGSNIGHFTLTEENKYRLKINPKDNTITIKKVKDSWSREELKSLLECAWNGGAFWGTSKPNSTYFDKWIEENL